MAKQVVLPVEVPPLPEEPQDNLAAGVAAGLAAVLLAILLWSALTMATGHNLVFAALGVGFMVGGAVRVGGNGGGAIFGAVGATLSLLGCAMGDVMAACAYTAHLENLPLAEVVEQLNPSLVGEILVAGARPLDLFLFAVAAYEGYKLSMN